MSDRPNIVYIFTDQQSAISMSCAGNADLHTPAIDSIAENGVRFEKAYVSFPLCSPARASMFTGKMPHQVGYFSNFDDMSDEDRLKGLGHTLKNAGYDCAYGGKWHIDKGYVDYHKDHGFEKICGFNDVELPQACVDYINRKHDKPFFLVASFDNPHNIHEWRAEKALPWGNIPEPPEAKDCPNLPANFAIPEYEPWFIREYQKWAAKNVAQSDWSVENWRRYRWAYNRIVEKVDAQIGVILDAIRKAGIEENTVIIFSSDHGDQQGAHKLSAKSVMYDESTRVPFIISRKGVTNKAVDSEHLVASCLDLFPTVCDYTGATAPQGICGRSLRPLIEGKDVDGWHNYVVSEKCYSQLGTDCRMIRTARYKYIAYDRGPNAEQLFDLENDPGEMVNLVVESRYKDVLQQHRNMLREWIDKTDDTFGGGHYAHPEVKSMVPGETHY